MAECVVIRKWMVVSLFLGLECCFGVIELKKRVILSISFSTKFFANLLFLLYKIYNQSFELNKIEIDKNKFANI